MGSLRFRKSVKLAPGVRLSVSKPGSTGVPLIGPDNG